MFGAAAQPLAYAVIVAEFALAALLVFLNNPATYWCAFTAVLALTLFYAIRLSVADSVRCSCWGRPVSADDSSSLKEAMLHPVLLAWRNGALAGAALVPLNALPLLAGGLTGLLPRLLMGIAAAEIITAIGLAASTIRKLRVLWNDAGEHPLAAIYAPRWVRVKGCRTFELDAELREVHPAA
jgi:hypothetical protein